MKHRLRDEYKHFLAEGEFKLRAFPSESLRHPTIHWRGRGVRLCHRLYAIVERMNGSVFLVEVHQ